MAKVIQEEEKEKILTSKNQLNAILKEKENKPYIFNGTKTYEYIVSSGSLILDNEMGGGFSAGLHRFTGFNGSGKTASAVNVTANFLKTVPNSKGMYIKAEGKFNDDLLNNSGIKFVFSADEWEIGTCFVLESCVAETVFSVMRELVKTNDEDIRYIFILDSMDGLNRKADLEKSFEEADQVAGGALITSVFLKKMALAMTRLGHMVIMISQVRANIKLNPYDKAPPKDNFSGGNSALHGASWILEFQPKSGKADFILPDSEAPIDRMKNRPLGHFCKVTVKKSPNDTTGLTIPYPIKHGKKITESIWREYEIIDMLKGWEDLYKKTKMSYEFSTQLKESALEAGFELVESIVGEAKVFAYLEANQELCSFLIEGYIQPKMRLLK